MFEYHQPAINRISKLRDEMATLAEQAASIIHRLTVDTAAEFKDLTKAELAAHLGDYDNATARRSKLMAEVASAEHLTRVITDACKKRTELAAKLANGDAAVNSWDTNLMCNVVVEEAQAAIANRILRAWIDPDIPESLDEIMKEFRSTETKKLGSGHNGASGGHRWFEEAALQGRLGFVSGSRMGW